MRQVWRVFRCLLPVLMVARLAGATVLDLDGHKVEALPKGQTNAVVFLFVSTECPISNSYAPEYRRLASEFGAKGILFRLIYPNADETTAAIRLHLKEYNLPLTAWRDPRHELVKESKARVTPEATVFVPGQGWVYHGRVDDRFADFGKARPEAVVHDLRDVLEKVARGEKITAKSTRAVGCYISGLN